MLSRLNIFRHRTKRQSHFYDVHVTTQDIDEGTVSFGGEYTNPVTLALRRSTGQPVYTRWIQGMLYIFWPGHPKAHRANIRAEAWLKKYDGMQYDHRKFGGPQAEPLSFTQKITVRVPRERPSW